jgi:hypothetical protein
MKKKLFIVVIVLALIIGVYYLFNSLFPKAEQIDCPAVENVISASLSDSDGLKTEINEEDIKQLITDISKVQSTRKVSVNDSPAIRPYYKIVIITEEREYYYFIYEEYNQIYLEIPYEGIYKSDRKIMDLVLKYNKK